MVTGFGVKGFKSFVEARLPLAPLTVLIGTNASGKSNLLEAMQLLSWIARATRLSEAVHAQREGRLPVRGRLQDWLAPNTSVIELSAAFEGTEPFDSLSLTLSLGLSHGSLRVVGEELDGTPKVSSLPLYRVEAPATPPSSDLSVAYNNFSRGKTKPHVTCTDQQAIFTQLLSPARFAEKHIEAQGKIPLACNTVVPMLGDALFLDPNPRSMRGYAEREYVRLTPDGSNVSAVVASLCGTPQSKESLLSFVRSLPEQDIVDVGVIETPRGEVMLEVVETFGGLETRREAALLSDGTLRVLAIAATLLSVSDGALVVIEEIDNGVHPSRAKLLLQRIHEVAKQRGLRVLLTTHNPALLDATPLEAMGDVVACFRDPKSGASRLERLSDLDDYAGLVAQGPLGFLATSGRLERALKARPGADLRTSQLALTKEIFRRSAAR